LHKGETDIDLAVRKPSGALTNSANKCPKYVFSVVAMPHVNTYYNEILQKAYSLALAAV
jgi:hypothetical protein